MWDIYNKVFYAIMRIMGLIPFFPRIINYLLKWGKSKKKGGSASSQDRQLV